MKRGEVWLVSLDPTIGSEIRKTRPSLIVSPDDMNERLRTVIVAPLTSKAHAASFRVNLEFDGVPGLVLLDQTRTVAKERVRKRLGLVGADVLDKVLQRYVEMFQP